MADHKHRPDEPKPKRGMPRSLWMALIPIGFLALVGLMVVYGLGSP